MPFRIDCRNLEYRFFFQFAELFNIFRDIAYKYIWYNYIDIP
jgi:hypothetical protein